MSHNVIDPNVPEQKTIPDSLFREGHERPPVSMGMPKPKQDTYQDLERKYRHRTYQAQELMVEKLLRGHFIPNEALDRRLRMFDLHLDAPYFMVVLVRPANQDNMFSAFDSDLRDGGQIGLIVSTIFSELLGEQMACFPANLDDRYAFLLNFAADAPEEVSIKVGHICRDAVKFIKDNFSLALCVCVSDGCEGLPLLHEAFRETNRVSDDKNTVYADGVCIRAEGGPPPPEGPELSIEKQYLNALITQDFETALQLTLERIQTFSPTEDKLDLNRIKMFLTTRLRTTTAVLALPMHALEEDGRNLGDEIMRLEVSNDPAEMEDIVTGVFKRLDRHFNSAPTDYSGTTGKVINLIAKRYAEPDLSVEIICDCLGKSRSYLSRMFKENTGMNLLDYLHTTRLTEAKKLLNETDLGISEIASKVGYYSGWTLARVFKRYEGITPTAYRKAFCNNAEL